jgi:hypothetical protein
MAALQYKPQPQWKMGKKKYKPRLIMVRIGYIIDNCLTTTKQLPDDFLTTVCLLPDDCLTTAWQLPDSCLLTAWQLPDDCLTTAWQLPDNCLTTAWVWTCSVYTLQYVHDGNCCDFQTKRVKMETEKWKWLKIGIRPRGALSQKRNTSTKDQHIYLKRLVLWFTL